MRRLCLCILISLPALLAESAHTSTSTVPDVELAVESETLSPAQLQSQASSQVITSKARQFTHWLSTAKVPDALNLVHGLMTDNALSLVQKEAILFRLTHRLRTLTPNAAQRAVMLELTAYQSKLRIEHHDDPRYTQPAFNIAASANGALNEWHYQELNAQLNSTNLIPIWQTADATERRYIVTALRNAQLDQATLADIYGLMMQQPLDYPDLTMAAAYGSGELETAAQMGSRVSASLALDMLKTLQSDTNPFSAAAAIELLTAISDHPDPAIAGLALSALASRHSDSDAIDTMIRQLPDPLRGVNAAMTLAKILTASQLQELQAESEQSNEMLQARIQLILQLRSETP